MTPFALVGLVGWVLELLVRRVLDLAWPVSRLRVE